MRAKVTKDGLTLQIIAGTHNAILGMDLEDAKRDGCLGFSIHRTSFGPVAEPFPQPKGRWLPNMLRFPSDTDTGAITKVADVYATEFMRMFEHYHFRASAAAAADASKPMGLDEDDSWSAEYYVDGSNAERDRKTFAGTL